MLNMALIIEQIRKNGNAATSAALCDLVTDHRVMHDRMISNYNRYKASATPDGVPVFNRKFSDAYKVNRKINNAFDVDIIDVKLGYMIGNPVGYGLNKDSYTEGETFNEGAFDLDMQTINDFNTMNNVEDLDGETLKMSSICGYGARLLYIDGAGKERVMNIQPWECIFIRDGSINEAQYALRYYEILDNGKARTMVEWYDEKNISYYISTEEEKAKGKTTIVYRPYQKNGVTSMPHMFTGIPLIQFMNNEEYQGDCDKVYSLIDAYDFTISDVSSEIEQFRLAYMAFYGMVPDLATMESAKKTGAFGMPDTTSRIEFITKQLNDTVNENHLNRLEENIYKFAKSVNFADEAFGGAYAISGIAMKFKMFGLESKCIISERKYTAALRTQYKILSSAWQVKGSKMNYLDMVFTWTRNFPLNLMDEAQTSAIFKGLISEATRLGLLSFIDDPEKEIQAMEIEAEGKVDLDEPEESELDADGNPIPPPNSPPTEDTFGRSAEKQGDVSTVDGQAGA